jgi:hypothetical protein
MPTAIKMTPTMATLGKTVFGVKTAKNQVMGEGAMPILHKMRLYLASMLAASAA